MRNILIIVMGLIWAWSNAGAQDQMPDFGAYPRLHAYNEFGDAPLYDADYSHWGYRNPEAPNGGDIRQSSSVVWQTFQGFGDGLGQLAPGIRSNTYDTLFTSNSDELFTAYVYLAEYYQMAQDRSWILFKVRDDAHWWDGTPVRAEDIAFSYTKFKDEGFAGLQDNFFAFIDDWQVLDDNRFFVRLTAEGAAQREFPFRLSSSVAIIPQAYWQDRSFSDILLEPPLGSGPYRVQSYDLGERLVYARVDDYWGKDHPANRGAALADTISYETIRDPEAQRIAFLARDLDSFGETTMERWVNAYERQTPLIEAGVMNKEAIASNGLLPAQMAFFNLRNPKFADPRVRRALAMAFDFETMNEQFFYGQYSRNNSYYVNYPALTAVGAPEGLELDILQEYADLQSPEARAANLAGVYLNPVTNGGGDNQAQLEAAFGLLLAAGYTIDGDTMLDPSGQPFVIEVMYDLPAFERIWQVYADSLAQLGIQLDLQVVDRGVWYEKVRNRDYEMLSFSFRGSQTPGSDIEAYFSTEFSNIQGSYGFAGLSDPLIDALYQRAKASENLQEIEAIGRVFDRHMRNQNYNILFWHSASTRLLWWDYFGRPEQLGIRLPLEGAGTVGWWTDAALVASTPARIEAAGGLPQ